MSADSMITPDRVAELRRAFDRSFAEAPPADAAPVEDLLEISVGAAPYALRIAEISGLIGVRTITPLPTMVPGLLGISSCQGSVLPVYDLGALLGYPIDETPRWLAITAATPLGLAFARFERHVRICREAIVAQEGGGGTLRHVREVFQIEGRVRSIVSVASVLDAITSRVRPGAGKGER